MPIRWGLCCQFVDAPIKFRTATHRYVSGLDADARRAYLAAIARDNAIALTQAVERCHETRHRRVPHQQPDPAARHAPAERLHARGPRRRRRRARSTAAFAAVAPARPRARRPAQLPPRPVRRAQLGARERGRGVACASSSSRPRLARARRRRHGHAARRRRHRRRRRRARSARARGRPLSPRARGRLALENDDRLFAPADLLPFCARNGRRRSSTTRTTTAATPTACRRGGDAARGRVVGRARPVPRAGRARAVLPRLLAARRLGRAGTRGRTPTSSIPCRPAAAPGALAPHGRRRGEGEGARGARPPRRARRRDAGRRRAERERRA